MPIIKKKGVTMLTPKRPVIGSCYSPKHVQYFDGRVGDYWESNAPVDGRDALKLQRAMLTKPKNKVPADFHTYALLVQMIPA